MPQQIQTQKIRKFEAWNSLVNETDLPPGTVVRADSVLFSPIEALSFGADWATVWGRTTLNADIISALSGADNTKTHFVTLTRSGYIFLIAFDLAASRPRFIYQVAGTGDPSLSAASGSSITAPNNAIYRNYTAGLNFYASVVQNEVWIGNGTDQNLAWASGALGILGPTTLPTDAIDPSQYVFPPCKTFLAGPADQVYATGNVTYPLRLWCSEPPTINYPLNHGIRTTAYSYRDIQANATATTGISSFGRDLIVHLDIGAPQIIAGYNGSSDGWKLSQQSTSANASAINPNCAKDSKLGVFYLGSDLEVYKLPTFRGSIVDRGYQKSAFRDEQIVTKFAPGAWHAQATLPISGSDYFALYAEKAGKTWMWMNLSVGGRQGVWCYDQRSNSITGPWRYPDFYCACQVRDDNINGNVGVGITRDGALLFADLEATGNFTPGNYTDPLPAACAGVLTPPTPDAGQGYVGLDAVNYKFTYVLNGQTLYLTDPWGEWSTSGSVTPTVYYNNAFVSIIEFAECDCSSEAIQKEFIAARLVLAQNSVLYGGVFAKVNGYKYGAWRGLLYPMIDYLAGIGGEGSTYKLRFIFIAFNAQPAVFSGLNVDYLPATTN